jgi:hypothetical protein
MNLQKDMVDQFDKIIVTIIGEKKYLDLMVISRVMKVKRITYVC